MRFTPLVTLALCAITAFVTFRAFRDPLLRERLIFNPQLILGDKQWYRLLSSALIHGDWMHCLFNLVSFFLFARGIEQFYGGLILFVVYVAAILGGSLLSLFLHRHHHYTALGASGGVCGVLMASIFMLPGTDIGMFFLPIFIPGWIYALIFLLSAFIGAKKQLGNAGHDAHLGGGVVGLLAALVIAPGFCLSMPWHYFGALALALACTAAFIFDPFGLKIAEHEAEKSSLRYQEYDESRDRKNRQDELNAILDKISAKGIHTLTKKERALLDEESAKKPRR